MFYILTGILILFGFFSWRKFLSPFSEDTVKALVKKSRFNSLEPYILAQIKVETGNYKSRLFKEAKNLFGMRCAKIREQKRLACFNEYAVFARYEDSVNDYLYWLEYSDFPEKVTGVSMFVYELKKRKYFEDSYDNYLRLMKTFLK